MGKVLRVFVWIGALLHGLRRITLDLITIAFLIGIGFFIFHYERAPKVPSNAILVVAPKGHLVYSHRQSPLRRMLKGFFEHQTSDTLIRTLTSSIERAAIDPRIKLMELDLRYFRGGSLTQLLSVSKALADFRKHGKSIYAYAPSYEQGTYLLAAQANHIFINPLGSVEIYGYADYHAYIKKLLGRLGVTVYAFREGKYKSAVEPFIRSDMSPAAREENDAWLSTWWSIYRENIAAARGLKLGQITGYSDHYPDLLAASNGDSIKLALKYKLINHVGTWHEYENAVVAAAGYSLKNAVKIRDASYAIATHKPVRSRAIIAVVPIDGVILGSATPVSGEVVSGATAAQLDRLAQDPSVHAVVLQVNSPGGSVTTAEAIRSAVLRLRAAGKPVVVSMGTLGASGAYLISSAAQSIFAHRTTITADIGVFALVPNFSKTLDKFGIGISGVSTSPFAGQLSPLVPLKPQVASALQKRVDYLYQRFVQQVAEGRHMTIEAVNQVAQGRAWSGVEAKRLKLVDHLGGMRKAIPAAANLAHLAPGKYRVIYLPSPEQIGFLHKVEMLSLQSMDDVSPGGALLNSFIYSSDVDSSNGGIRNMLLILHDAYKEHYFDYYPFSVKQ